MLMLIVEIFLTVTAWRKGWKAWALLPWGIFMVTAFMTGVALGAATNGNLDPNVLNGVGFLYELMLVITLAVMSLVSPKRQPPQLPQPDKPVESEAQKPVEFAEV